MSAPPVGFYSLLLARPRCVSVAACQICIQLQPALEALCLPASHPDTENRENVIWPGPRVGSVSHGWDTAVTMGNGS